MHIVLKNELQISSSHVVIGKVDFKMPVAWLDFESAGTSNILINI